MKGFLIFCSAFISIWMFLPFIQDYSIFWIHKLTKDYVDNSEIVLFLIMFIISSWFISIWYSKKVKISILWIIGTLFYLYMYYHIIDFILDYDDYASYLFKNESWINYILALLWDFWKTIWIWFYFIFLWFLWNTLWIFGIIYKTYLSLNNFWKNVNNFFILKTNPNAVIRDDWMRMYEKNEAKEVIKEEVEKVANIKEKSIKNETLKVLEINKTKLISYFIIWNIWNLLFTSFTLFVFIGTFWEMLAYFTPTQLRWFLLWIILSVIFLNLHLINRYINRFIEEKILFRYYIWIWLLFFVIFYSTI